MDFLPEKIEKYVVQNTRAEGDLLATLNRETYTKMLTPRMLSGHLQGQVLRMLAMMIKQLNVLEIGTFTGYSAICFASALKPGGKIYTIDNNPEIEETTRKYFKRAGVEAKIEFIVDDAIKVIPELNETFDLVFIDADKENYCNYFDLAFPKLKKGGYIFADNVLWSGKVLEPYNSLDKDTKAIVNFNNKVNEDKRVENVLFPIRDGLMVIRKV